MNIIIVISLIKNYNNKINKHSKAVKTKLIRGSGSSLEGFKGHLKTQKPVTSSCGSTTLPLGRQLFHASYLKFDYWRRYFCHFFASVDIDSHLKPSEARRGTECGLETCACVRFSFQSFHFPFNSPLLSFLFWHKDVNRRL